MDMENAKRGMPRCGFRAVCACAIVFLTGAVAQAELPEKTVRQLEDARAVCDEMARTVPQLEAKGKGQYSRMAYEVMRWCLDGMEKEDLPAGWTNRVIREAREISTFARPELERTRRILAGEEEDIPVPRFKSGDPVRADGAILRGTRVWPDGRVERDAPVIFNGWGHFGRVRRELPLLEKMGFNFLQMEEGIYKFLPEKGVVVTNAIKPVYEVADTAWKCNSRVDFLPAPHYVPGWLHKELPKDNGKCDNGFMKICIHDRHVNGIFARYEAFVAGLLADRPAIHSITLMNEPHSGNVSECKSMKALWERHLSRTFKTVEEMNGKWGTQYASFASVEVPKFPELPETPAALEFIRFSRGVTSGFHAGLARAVRKAAPGLPVHSKIVANESLSGKKFQSFWSIDIMFYAENMDYLDHDSIAFTHWDPKSQYAARWTENEAPQDYLRSFAAKPVMNSENHNLVDCGYGDVPPMHCYAALWQNVIHGQTATALWCWERGVRRGDIMIGLAPEHPHCLFELGKCSLDVQRLSSELAPIMAQRPTVLVLHSLATQVLSGKNGLWSGYAAASFLGETVGVIGEESLARYAKDGLRRLPFDTARVIVLPSATHLPREALKGLRRLESEGMKIVVSGEVPAFDDCKRKLQDDAHRWKPIAALEDKALHAALAAKMGEWKLSCAPKAVDPQTGLPAFGVEARGYVTNGVWRVSLCNQLRIPVEVDLGADGVDLITTKKTSRRLTLQSRTPVFAEIPLGRIAR